MIWGSIRKKVFTANNYEAVDKTVNRLEIIQQSELKMF